jgi:glycosyltransferase involved in cell wall biosynthesis
LSGWHGDSAKSIFVASNCLKLNNIKNSTVKDQSEISKVMESNRDEEPLVTIVTPSYNQGEFIEKTIKSVVEQDYPKIEYIIMDGGSTDESVSIIKKYAKKYKNISWVSKKDKGQTDAINKGIQKSSGEIIAFLNSDDTYNPGVIRKIVNYFNKNKKAKIIYGEGMYIDRKGKNICRYQTLPFNKGTLMYNCYICQPTVFIKKEVFDKIGLFNEKLQSCMDYEYWIRASKKFDFFYFPEYFATSRMYEDNKTIGQRATVYKEVIKTIKKHYKYVPMSWVLGYADYKINKVDQFFKKSNKNKYLIRVLAIFMYLRYNYDNPERLFKAIKKEC